MSLCLELHKCLYFFSLLLGGREWLEWAGVEYFTSFTWKEWEDLKYHSVPESRKVLKESQKYVQKTAQFSPVAQLCPTLCDPTNRSMPGLPIHHQCLESTQTHVHCVSDAIQPLSSPSPPAPNLSQHQGLFKLIKQSLKSVQLISRVWLFATP